MPQHSTRKPRCQTESFVDPSHRCAELSVMASEALASRDHVALSYAVQPTQFPEADRS